MQIHFLGQRPVIEHGVAVCIGNFDGLHLGHQALLRSCVDSARRLEIPAILLSFSPHPRSYFARRAGRPVVSEQLTPLRAKLAIAQSYGIAGVGVILFNERLASCAPTDFFKDLLLQKLNARAITVGYDWRFGKDRAGTIDDLRQLGSDQNCEVSVIEPVMVSASAGGEPERVSTSGVKAALAAADLCRTEILLGRKFAIHGRVVTGAKRGASLGTPTANIFSPNQFLPKDGVYATQTTVDGKAYPSVTNVGSRPTFGETNQRQVETHLLENRPFSLYGAQVQVQFLHYLRPERRFSTSAELVQQIKLDCEQARAMLHREP